MQKKYHLSKEDHKKMMVSDYVQRLTNPRNDYEKESAERLKMKLDNKAETEISEGVVYWVMPNGKRPAPMHIAYFARFLGKDISMEGQREAIDDHSKAFLEEYRKRNANRVISAEEQFEMRAAFGPDETVVDIITGQRFNTGH